MMSINVLIADMTEFRVMSNVIQSVDVERVTVQVAVIGGRNIT